MRHFILIHVKTICAHRYLNQRETEQRESSIYAHTVPKLLDVLREVHTVKGPGPFLT